MTYTVKHKDSNTTYGLTESELQEYAFLHTVFIDAKHDESLILTTQEIASYTYYITDKKLARYEDQIKINTPDLLETCIKPLRIHHLKTQIEQSYTNIEKDFISQNYYCQISLLRIKFKPILITLQYLGASDKYNKIINHLDQLSLDTIKYNSLSLVSWISYSQKQIRQAQKSLENIDPENQLMINKVKQDIYFYKYQINLSKKDLSLIKDNQIIDTNYYNL